METATRDRLFNWARLRAIGELPLFGVSYAVVLLSIALLNSGAMPPDENASGLLRDSRALVEPPPQLVQGRGS